MAVGPAEAQRLKLARERLPLRLCIPSADVRLYARRCGWKRSTAAVWRREEERQRTEKVLHRRHRQTHFYALRGALQRD